MAAMKWLLTIAFATLAFGVHAQSQSLSDAAKEMIGTWEFSNAGHDKSCSVTFGAERAGAGYRVKFDADCANLFPLVKQISGWKHLQGDLLYLIDAKGQALISFSEVEDGIFEAPTPGLGILFLQNSTVRKPETKRDDDVTGSWAVVRGAAPPLCVLTLAAGGFSVTAQPGCDPSLVRLEFTQWRLDGRDLLLIPSSGEPWRFEEADGNWRRLSNDAEPLMLVRQ
jgi:hypothetical protein